MDIKEDGFIRIISARKATQGEWGIMKLETIKKRLSKNRPMVSVTLRLPEDVVSDLKKVAPLKGFSGCQGLLRAYVGAGLREDLERMEGSALAPFIERLCADGAPEATLNKVTSG